MNKTTPPSVVSNLTSTPAPAVSRGFTLGPGSGRPSAPLVCVLDAAGRIVRAGAVAHTRPALARLMVDFPGATVAIEAGTHSPWLSRYLTGLGAKGLVAHLRQLHAISRSARDFEGVAFEVFGFRNRGEDRVVGRLAEGGDPAPAPPRTRRLRQMDSATARAAVP